MDKHGRCLIAVSEGILASDGKPFMTKLTGSKEADAHGNLQLSGTGALGDMLADLIKEKLKIKRVRADTLGYAQRSYVGVVSDVDAHEAREVGEKAAQFAIWHDVDGSIVIKRTGNYSVDYQIVSLDEVAAKTKTIPKEFLNAKGNDTTWDFYNYGRPLLGSGFPTCTTCAHRRWQRF